jgi:diaminopimelate epimerase
MPERDLRTKDVANAAAVLLDAVQNAPGRDSVTVSTPHGPVDVVLDNAGADVVLRGRDATVHVRSDG